MNYLPPDAALDEPDAMMVMLHGRYPIPQLFLTSIRLQLGDVCQLLDPAKEYGAKQLCGEPFWTLLKFPEWLLAGSCISHLVRYGQLPLVKVSLPGRSPCRYVLAD